MYLHEDREQFADAVRKSVQHTNMSEMIIEKDYYVTMILRLLSQKLQYVVFKGGTSLSKCHRVIKRFSEDIDITIDTSLSQGEKKKLKYVLVDIAEELGMNISNLEDTRSRRNYNRYQIEYKSAFEIGEISICPSAQDDVDIPALLQLITEQEIYKDDYQNLTEVLLEEDVSYETAVQAVEKIRVSGMFEKY